MNYVFFVKVAAIEERFEKRHISGVKEEAKFEDRSIGWYVTFENHVSFFLGYEKPNAEVGQKIKLTLEL